uniref:Leucine zipper protein 1 n=1 Tax=Leptobrachium leishanense TaxID=445787 RepID=A0A8C5PC21_9ANUR
MEHSSRHLRFKLQSLGRRLDELEEATQNLQKAEDEVLDLQDKIIQAEGSNSSMLADVEALRKRVLKIEGKDEEVKKAEDLCRLIKEKLENEENLTRELRSEIEQLQKQMSELEKLEESFNKSKNDCTQLCLGLNEEKNMSKKLTSELENLRAKVKELELSESKSDQAEQFITGELEKIKCLTVSFVNEKKCFLEKEKQNEKLILDLKKQLELKNEMTTGDQPRNDSNLLQRSSDQNIELCNVRIEDSLNSKSSHTVGFDYIKQSEIQTSSKDDNDNKNQEDNKIRHLNQEIEKLRNQIKHFEGMEEELKQLKENHGKLQNDYVDEQAKNKQLADEIKTLKRQGNLYNNLENGILDTEEITSRARYKHDRKHKALSFDSPASKNTLQELSPQLSRSERHQPKDFPNSDLNLKKTSNSSTNIRKSGKYMPSESSIGSAQKKDDSSPSSKYYGMRDFGAVNETKKSSDHPSVLSRYPPAAQEQTIKKAWKSSTSKPLNVFGEDYSIKAPQTVDNSRREVSASEPVFRETSSYINFDNKVNSNLPEDLSVENFSLTSMSYSKPGSSELESIPASDVSTSDVMEDLPKIVNIGDHNLVDTTQPEKSSRNSRYLGKDEVTSYSNAEGSKTSRFNNNEKILASDQDLNSQTSYYNRRRARGKPSLKPQIPEKPHILETSNKELDKRNIHVPHSRKQISPKENTSYDMIPIVDNDNQVSQRTFIPETKSVSPDSIESTETQAHPGVRSKTFSPREALQSTVVIKPAIVEKDVKEIMRSYRETSSSDISRPLPSTTQANKVSTSITFYPSEAGSTHVSKDVTLRERHTSTSNIRLSAIDQPVLKNNISIPYEISIRKEEVLLNVANDSDLNRTELNTFAGPSFNRERMKNSDFYRDFEAVSWKRHSILDTNHLDRTETRRSTLRKGILGSTEELDILNTEKDFSADTKPRRKSVAEEEKPARLSHEEYPRTKYSILNRTSPELISRRSQSSLSATEVIERRNSPIKKSAAPALWNRYSVEDTGFMSSRIRKYEIDKGPTIGSIGRKSSSRHEMLQSQRHMKTTVEDRIRQLEH